MHRIHYRFGRIILLLILATITVTLAAPSGDAGRFVAVILQAAVLVAAVSPRGHPGVVLATTVAAAVGIAGAGAALFGTGQSANSSAAVSRCSTSSDPLALVSGVSSGSARPGRDAAITMFGVLCLYLLWV